MKNSSTNTKEIKEHVIKMYDERKDIYHRRYTSEAGQYVLKRKVKKAIRLGKFKKGDMILEVGCANGSFVFGFADNGFKVTGSDISTESIEWAKSKAIESGYNNVEFVAADAEDLSVFDDNTFDGVFSFNTLRYVPNPQKAICEMYRVVKKDKPVVADFPNKYSPYFKFIRPLRRGKFRKFIIKSSYAYEHLFSTREVKALFENAGFIKIKAKRISYPQTQTPSKLLVFFKVIDFISELPIINLITSIILCTGRKK